jgi:pyridoxamine 5'-phosphate oxidase
MSKSVADIRKDYMLASFDEKDALANPIEQFTHWWNDAINSNIDEVNAMTLATVTPKGTPTARIVLLKGYDENGFVFFTNYLSDKGKELANNPTAALVFFWKELERQIRIEGTVEKVSNEENDAYFNSRPAGSKIGAWASHQSAVIEYRQVIEQNVQKYTEIFDTENIPRPDHWGGYKVTPHLIEFWQGRSSRLHDRIQYRKDEQEWIKERLSP